MSFLLLLLPVYRPERGVRAKPPKKAKKGGPRVCSDFLLPEDKPAECAAKQRLTRRWGMMAWRVRAAITEDRMWALGGSRSPKRARHANWERAQCRQSEHFCGRGRGASSSAGRSGYCQF